MSNWPSTTGKILLWRLQVREYSTILPLSPNYSVEKMTIWELSYETRSIANTTLNGDGAGDQ